MAGCDHPRREVIRPGGAACAAAAFPPLAAVQPTVPVALQLYSLRNECKAGLPGTLAAIDKIGFSSIEWFGWGGYFDRPPKELRRMLDDNNLKTCSDHNHSAGFVRLKDGRVPWEILFDNTGRRQRVVHRRAENVPAPALGIGCEIAWESAPAAGAAQGACVQQPG